MKALCKRVVNTYLRYSKSILTNLICIHWQGPTGKLCNFQTFTWYILFLNKAFLAFANQIWSCYDFSYFQILYLNIWNLLRSKANALFFLFNWLTYNWNQNEMKQLTNSFLKGNSKRITFVWIKFSQKNLWVPPFFLRKYSPPSELQQRYSTKIIPRIPLITAGKYKNVFTMYDYTVDN